MALLDSEVTRIRYELGYPLLTTGAEPWIGIAAAFDTVIQPYLRAGASTTSTTAVTAASSPTPTTITLASATGFTTGDRLVIDVDARQEIVTLQNLSSTSATVLLKLAHSGTYPVTVEGGETIVRSILKRLISVGDKIETMTSAAGVKKVDEIEFFGDSSSSTVLQGLHRQRDDWRNELASAIGLERMNGSRTGGATTALY